MMSKPAIEPVRRCKWCENRIGQFTYFVDGEWQVVPNPIHLFGDAPYTDGMCPDCLAAETAKLGAI